MDRQTRAMPFYIDTTLVAVGGLAAAFAGGDVWQAALCGAAGYLLMGLFIGVLHRFALSPGQLVARGAQQRPARSPAAHALIFTGAAGLTLLFMIGCALAALVPAGRLAAQ